MSRQSWLSESCPVFECQVKAVPVGLVQALRGTFEPVGASQCMAMLGRRGKACHVKSSQGWSMLGRQGPSGLVLSGPRWAGLVEARPSRLVTSASRPGVSKPVLSGLVLSRQSGLGTAHPSPSRPVRSLQVMALAVSDRLVWVAQGQLRPVMAVKACLSTACPVAPRPVIASRGGVEAVRVCPVLSRLGRVAQAKGSQGGAHPVKIGLVETCHVKAKAVKAQRSLLGQVLARSVMSRPSGLSASKPVRSKLIVARPSMLVGSEPVKALHISAIRGVAGQGRPVALRHSWA